MKKFIFPIIAMVFTILLVTLTGENSCFAMAAAPVAFQRNMFKAAREWAVKNQIKNTNWEPSYLRIEKAFVNGQGTYDFNIKVESGQIVTEKKLDRNDVFCCTHMMVYLLNATTAELGKNLLQTFPNQTEFASASAYDLTDLQAVYNGYLWLKTEQTVNAEAIPMINFLHVPETQKSAATNYSKFNVNEHAYFPGNVFFFKGWSSIEVKVTFPTWSGQTTQTGASGRETRLVFHPYGFLLKSANDRG